MSENSTHIVKTQSLEWQELTNGKSIRHYRKDLTAELTSNKLVASIYRIPPGKVNWPFHYHAANEEVFYILEGEGELRTHNDRLQVAAGDFIRFPAGRKGAHQLKNTSEDQELIYIDLGTAIQPDISVMPDSNKVAVMAGSAPNQNKSRRYFSKFFKLNNDCEFFDDEL